jgi:hypothetical protein
MELTAFEEIRWQHQLFFRGRGEHYFELALNTCTSGSLEFDLTHISCVAYLHAQLQQDSKEGNSIGSAEVISNRSYLVAQTGFGPQLKLQIPIWTQPALCIHDHARQ